MLYDLTDRESFDNLNSWLIEIEKNGKKDICKILIGTNCDLEDERKITYQEGKDFATSNGMKFIEVSVKNDTNIKESIEILVEDIMNNISNGNKADEKKVKPSLPEITKKGNCYII